jgi:methyl-accepting chemotaxis protein
VKLFGLSGLLIAFLVLVGVIGLLNLSSSASIGRSNYTANTVPVEQLGVIRAYVGNLDADILHGLSGATGFTDAVGAFKLDAHGLDQTLKAYGRSGLSAAERPLYRSFKAQWAQYTTVAQTLGNQLGAGERQAALATYHASAWPLNSSLDHKAKQLVAINDRDAAAGAVSLTANYSSSRTLMLILIAAAILLGAASRLSSRPSSSVRSTRCWSRSARCSSTASPTSAKVCTRLPRAT